ncbi:MAG: hypothetical protein KGR26_08550 [Cyanobacteria bacterium REEB65]|nr:hypothetical protein [Cyanobacteria bacterium REEB65]
MKTLAGIEAGILAGMLMVPVAAHAAPAATPSVRANPSLLWPGPPESGFALRQTTLVAGWPDRSPSSPLPAGALGLADSRLRSWIADSWYGVKFEGALELSSDYGSGTLSNLGLLGSRNPGSTQPFDIVNLRWQEDSPAAAALAAEVERFDLRWTNGPVDFDVGRQPITLGTSHFVSVLDVLAPFAPGSLDASYKPGIDALRVREGFGDSGEAELIVSGSDPWNQGGTIGRLHGTLGPLDVEVLGGRFRHRTFGGIDWDGQIGQAGMWGEVAAFERLPAVERYRGGLAAVALAAVAGADFDLPYEVQSSIGVLYQDFGARRPQDLEAVYTDAPFQQGWDFLGSAGYAVVTLSHPITPLLSGSLAGLVNLVDASTLWQPRLTYSVSDNADLGAYAWLGTGAPPKTANGQLLLMSEFGTVPTGGGLYARWFF